MGAVWSDGLLPCSLSNPVLYARKGLIVLRGRLKRQWESSPIA
jgi:hypothetical protein